MIAGENRIGQLAEFIHRSLLWLLVASYILAAVIPGPGLWLRSVDLARLVSTGLPRISLPSIMLGFLLFNAGLGVRSDRVWGLARKPALLMIGVVANLVLPVAFIFIAVTTMHLWHNPQEVQEILVGLALIASLPVAGSSTAWAQDADGDLTLSVGLVLFSTCLSPITTPLVLHAVGWMADGTYAETLHGLAVGEVGGFLGMYVLIPSLVGMAIRGAVGGERIARCRSHLKLASSSVLLILCYANASVALPQTIRNPDWDYLAVMLVIVTAMCVLGFGAGGLIGRLTHADRAQKASLMFGLGMTNNGTGLVIAAGALQHMPMVMLPIIFYNLIQHVVAAFVGRYLLGARGAASPLPIQEAKSSFQEAKAA